MTFASGNTNEAWATITVEDKLAPILTTNDLVNISFDQNGEINIIPDMVLEAIKSGDVNDDIVLPREASVNLSEVDLSFEDQILNIGEGYSIFLQRRFKIMYFTLV